MQTVAIPSKSVIIENMEPNYNTRQTLIQRAKDPTDHEAWGEFVHYYQRFIYFILTKMEVSMDDMDDLVQEILLALWNKLPEYERRNAKFRSWLSVVTRNTAINHLRVMNQYENRRDLSGDIIENLNAIPVSELENEIEKEWKVYLSTIAVEQIEKLVPNTALEVFTLSLDGMATEEIAAQLNITKDSVYTLKNRVRTRLAQEIKQLIKKLEF